MEQWFDAHQLRPQVRHEFEDSAVLKVFGQAGEGLILTPTATERDVAAQYSLKLWVESPRLQSDFMQSQSNED